MPGSLPALEAERSRILRQIASLGDLRPGSICAIPRRCGKLSCHCAKLGDPGHHPQLRLSRTVHGKTVAESFASSGAFRKTQAEVQEYQRWQSLCAEFGNIHERICRLRPVQKPDEKWSAEEKNGCCGPSRNHARGRYPVAAYLRRTAQGRRLGLGSRGVGVSNGAALRWSSGFGRTPPPTGTDSNHGALRLRPPCPLSRICG